MFQALSGNLFARPEGMAGMVMARSSAAAANWMDAAASWGVHNAVMAQTNPGSVPPPSSLHHQQQHQILHLNPVHHGGGAAIRNSTTSPTGNNYSSVGGSHQFNATPFSPGENRILLPFFLI